MATLKQQSQAILREKQSKLLPENIKAGVQIFDVVGTLDGDSSSSDVKLFETIEELNNDTSAKLNDLAVVYRNEIQNAKVDSKFSKVKFPSTVVLPSVIEDYAEVMYRATDASVMFECWGSLDANMFDMSCYTESGSIRIRYESADGITYTRTDGGDETIDFGTEIYYYNTEYWNDAIGYFMQVGNNTFEGLFQYKQYLDKYFSLGIIDGAENTSRVPVSYDTTVIDFTRFKELAQNHYFSDSNNGRFIIGKFDDKYYMLSDATISYASLGVAYMSDGTYDLLTRDAYSITFHELNLDDYTIVNSTTYNFNTSWATYNGYTWYRCSNAPRMTAIAAVFDEMNGFKTTTSFNTLPENSTDRTGYFIDNLISYVPYYKYDYADTQFNLKNANELLPGKVGYGNNGTIVGDGSIYGNLDITKLNDALGINIQIPNYCNIDGINAEVNALYSVVVDEENGEHAFYVPVGSLKCPSKDELEALVRENYDDVYDTISFISAPYPTDGCKCVFILDFKNTDNKHQVYVLFYDFSLNSYVSCLRVFNDINAQFSISPLGLGTYFVSYTAQSRMVITCLSNSTAPVTNEIAIAVIDVFEMRVVNTNITTMLENNYIRKASTALKDNVLVVFGIVDNDENIFVMEFDMSNLSVKSRAQSTLSGVTTLHYTSACKLGNDYYIQCYSPNPYTDYLMKYDAASNSITHVVIPSASSFTRNSNTTVFTDGTYVYVRPNTSSVYKYSSDLVKQETISNSGSTNLLSNLYYWDFDITDVKNYTCSSIKGRVSVVNGVESLNAVSGIRPTNNPAEDYGGGTGSSVIYGHVPDSGAENLSTYLYYDDKYIIGLQSNPAHVSITKGIHNNASVIMQAKSISRFNLVSNSLI